MSWHMVEDVAVRIARILIVALLGAMLDAGLFEGRVGERAVEPLVSLSKLSAGLAASPQAPSRWE